jgi:hypothetical protein
MPDATDTNVDGVEPSIFVRLLNVVENPFSVALNDVKKLVKDGEPVKVTRNELAKLGAFAIEIVDDVEDKIEDEVETLKSVETKEITNTSPSASVTPATRIETSPAVKPAGESSPVNTPGQSGQ